MHLAVKSLYKCTNACVKVNGNLTDWFHVKPGVRQGDSLSPILFKLFLNSLLNELDSLINGICINGKCITHLLYTDDIVQVIFGRGCRERRKTTNAT